MTRAPVPRIDTDPILLQLNAIPELHRLRDLDANFAEATADIISAIVEQAAQFAADRLETLNLAGEDCPPSLKDGQVKVNDLHKDVWREYANAGWLTLDLPVSFGGQGLPLVVAVAVQEIFDRHCSAFGMLPVPVRSAVRLIDAHAGDAIKEEWLPKLISGEWGATICVSEIGAGSDVMRIKTTATIGPDGAWAISGQKQWISFGGHDLTACIGHCLLARTEGSKGLSLFLVPDRIGDAPNGVTVTGIERKLGLHSSPTCALHFENAAAQLLGEEGRGLSQMFVMITNMRLSTAAMGLGIATGPADIALAYARERRQGGSGPEPVAIIDHLDVQRQLLEMQADVEMARGLIYMAAALIELGRHEVDEAAAREAASHGQWLLPIVKTLGGDTAFQVSSAAIQVLGGSGYTADWPVEQALRDARVLTVFEGTTGMQALDLLHRRLWKDRGAGLAAFIARARTSIATLSASDGGLASEADRVIDILEVTGMRLTAMQDNGNAAEAGATAFLDLATHAGKCWTAVRLACLDRGEPGATRLIALAEFYLTGAASRAEMLARQSLLGADRLRAISALSEA